MNGRHTNKYQIAVLIIMNAYYYGHATYTQRKELQDLFLPLFTLLTINYCMDLQFEVHISSTLFAFLLIYINFGLFQA